MPTAWCSSADCAYVQVVDRAHLTARVSDHSKEMHSGSLPQAAAHSSGDLACAQTESPLSTQSSAAGAAAPISYTALAHPHSLRPAPHFSPLLPQFVEGPCEP